jgi:hypothetical protein
LISKDRIARRVNFSLCMTAAFPFKI